MEKREEFERVGGMVMWVSMTCAGEEPAPRRDPPAPTYEGGRREYEICARMIKYEKSREI